MDRTDSAFDEAFRLNIPHERTIHRSNTAPTRERKIKTPPPLSPPNFSSTAIRPASEKRPSTQRRSAEPRRKSLTSSSDNSTNKSRRQKHGSLPSSRRTSCTIVDPSRPARHYRIKSAQTVPTSTGDIDDVLALHFRSCSIFQNPSYHQASSLPSPLSGKFPGDSGGDNAMATDFGGAQSSYPRAILHVATPTTDFIEPESSTPIENEHTISNTTMHWISPSTRRDQYRKFDRQNKGLRGLVRKFLPRCVSGPPALQFYEQDKGDASSVRRYRMDVDDDEEDEKDALRKQQRKPERSATDLEGKKKWWGCI